MDVILIEPCFPSNQREFARALAQVGARVIGIGEAPKSALTSSLREYLFHYEQVSNVCNPGAVLEKVRWIQGRANPQRLEATVEAHMMSAAKVREAAGIPGTSVHTTFLCRDKPAMKEALRKAGVPCAASMGSSDPNEIVRFAREVGYPIIIKPRDGAGAAGTFKCSDDAELAHAIKASGADRGADVAVEEFIEGHEAFYDTITIDGAVAHDFVSHYYPNVLEAMRTRHVSPQFIATNRIDEAKGYAEVREMGKRVIEALGIGSSATHMEWFFGPKGLKFSEIGCRPPGVGAWDLYCHANDMDVYKEWAMALVHGRPGDRPSRRYAAGIVALRPDRDGVISHVEGVDEAQRLFGKHVIDFKLPSAGQRTLPVEGGYMANGWIRLKHPDYDTLREMLNAVGKIVRLRAR